MKYILSSLLLILVGFSQADAYELTVTEVSKPYEIVSITEVPQYEHVYLGELNNFPVMYEFIAAEPFTLTAKLSQLDNSEAYPLKLSLMIVRLNDNGGGVTEITRFNPSSENWKKRKDPILGLSFLDSNSISKEVDAGVYRIEVSTPENTGRYSLLLGNEKGEFVGYFKTLSQVRVIQKFYGTSVLKILTSSYVYYPLGIIFMLFMFRKTWKYRH